MQTITVSTKDQDLNGHFRMSFMGAISHDVVHDATADEMRRRYKHVQVDEVTVTAEDLHKHRGTARATWAPLA